MPAPSDSAATLSPVRRRLPRPAGSVLASALALTSSGCLALVSEPWSRFQEGASTVELSSGFSEQRANLALDGQDGTLAALDSSRSEDLRAEYVIGVRGQTFVSDDWSVGGGLEWWRHKSVHYDFEAVDLINRPFNSLRYMLSSRYLFPALGSGQRWSRVRPFFGTDFFYVSDMDVRLIATYPEDPEVDERLDFKGSGFYGYGLGAGLAFLVADDTLLELGGRWSQNLSASEDEVIFTPPGGEPSRVDTEFDPEGWSLYVSLTYSF